MIPEELAKILAAAVGQLIVEAVPVTVAIARGSELRLVKHAHCYAPKEIHTNTAMQKDFCMMLTKCFPDIQGDVRVVIMPGFHDPECCQNFINMTRGAKSSFGEMASVEFPPPEVNVSRLNFNFGPQRGGEA